MKTTYLAGCLSTNTIHWAVWMGEEEGEIDTSRPGWSPYAAMAFRFTDKEKAKEASLATPKTFNLPASKPVIVCEEDAFEPLSEMKYELVSKI